MEDTKIYELTPRYDTRKSFYGKAIVKESVEEQDNMIYESKDLYSYGTLVANITYNRETNLDTYQCFGRFSQTTTRHQKEFFKQNGLNDMEIKEIFKRGIL